MYAQSKITHVAATVAALMGFDAPTQAAPPNDIILARATADIAHGEHVDRVLLYNPDAVALHLYARHTDLLASMLMRTSLQLPLESVMPSVTPVCFASMYTGAEPEIHGIRKYEKPIVRTDTLFDAAIRAGKRCAIVADPPCSIAKIFLERDMDYYFFDSIDAINEKARALIEADAHDLIVVYHTNYDATMHRHGPEAPESLDALRRNAADFAALTDFARETWREHNIFYGFCPDHGCHAIDGGCGSHGLDCDEDMLVIHGYGWAAKH